MSLMHPDAFELNVVRAERDKLREQVAAQASEIESLRISYDAACMLVAQMHEAAMGEVIGPYHGVVEDVRNKVAAQAAVIEKLTKWLHRERSYYLEAGSDIEEDVCDYLSIPTDSKEILAEVRRAERERVAVMFEESGIGGDHLAEAIRAME